MGISNIDGENENVGGDPLLLILIALFILFMIITVGTLGYRVFGKVAWIDAFHNASMVLTSTSLVTPIKNYNGKIFSSFYNLLTGIFVLVIIGVIIRRSLVESGISTSSTNNNNNSNNSNSNTTSCDDSDNNNITNYDDDNNYNNTSYDDSDDIFSNYY